VSVKKNLVDPDPSVPTNAVFTATMDTRSTALSANRLVARTVDDIFGIKISQCLLYIYHKVPVKYENEMSKFPPALIGLKNTKSRSFEIHRITRKPHEACTYDLTMASRA
jgi:hypothetical protein